MAIPTARAERTHRRQVDRFDERRNELADAALHTLSELGYARTSLREIAQHSTFSHGVLHYYFTDKVDLITFCVRRYKSVCVRRYDEIVSMADTAAGLVNGFADGMVATLQGDAPMHRLWYDLRSQALFEPAFRDDVLEIDGLLEQMIWRVVTRYSELTECPVNGPSGYTYALFDGLFQRALLRYLAGAPTAAAELHADVRRLLPRTID